VKTDTRALHLRNRDRHLNMHQYPKLHYPEIYILQGGYSGFFAHHKGRCEPQNYVAMQDERHKDACAREMRNFGKNPKLIRTQSYTYGVSATNQASVFSMMDSQDEDETMNTEDDTFEGIENKVLTTSNANVRRMPLNTSKLFLPGRRSVSY
jgi:M-phase inducer tyrosine phosphatase